MSGSCSDAEDDYDLEAEFERELALLGDDPEADGEGSAQKAHSLSPSHHISE